MNLPDFDVHGFVRAMIGAGHGDDIAWAESIERVMYALTHGGSAYNAFGHRGKASAIDAIWRDREALLAGYLAAADKLAFCESLPWIGGITKYHLAKNFGAQVAKPDVHLQRLAATFDTSPQALCEALAARSGLKVATIDTLLWRGAAVGLLNTRTGAFAKGPNNG